MSTKRILDKAIKLIDASSFKKGDTFKNANGVIMKVLDPTKEGHMQVQSGNRVFLTTPESFQNMLTKNGYKRTNDAMVKITYEDAVGDSHTFIKSSVEEAKKWIDEGKFPHGKAFNIKINGQLYKKQVMGR